MGRAESVAVHFHIAFDEKEHPDGEHRQGHTIIGQSPESFAKAAPTVAVSEAAKTLRGISGAHVI